MSYGSAGYGSTAGPQRGPQGVPLHPESLMASSMMGLNGSSSAWRDNINLASYYVTKHSWKGKYKRIFTIGTHGVITYKLETMEVTNQWLYSEIITLAPVHPKALQSPSGSAPPTLTTGAREEFTLHFVQGKSRKANSMKFSSEYRSEILCEVLLHRHQFSDAAPALAGHYEAIKYNCFKHGWRERKDAVIIEVGLASVNQRDPRTNRLICSYLFKDIDSVGVVSDSIGGFYISHGGFGRLHMFSVAAHDAAFEQRREELLKRIVEMAYMHTGTVIRIKKDPITTEWFHSNKFGKYNTDEAITSLCEFTVQKQSPRDPNGEVTKRILALSDTCLIERDPNSYSIVTLKPLSEIFALIRSSTNPQLFSVEYVKGQVRAYISTDRDALLASLMDGVRASGNIDIHVKSVPTLRGNRIGSYSVPVDEEVESLHLKFLQNVPPHWTFNEAVNRFNCNCAYSGLIHSVTQDGLFSQNKEKLIQLAIMSFVEKEDINNINLKASNEDLEQHFQALRRLVASKAGFACFSQAGRFREYLGIKVVNALKRNNDAINHAAIDMLCALMQPMHEDYDLRQEQLNKTSLLASKDFLESLLDVLKLHVDRGTGALVVASMLDFLTFALCAPYSETTDGAHFDSLLAMVAAYGRPIFKLFHHPSLAIVKGAGLVMKAIIEEGDGEISTRMQQLAMSEGALARHLHIALYSPASDGRFLAVQHLSRQLVSLWIAGNDAAFSLLRRIFPIGLLNFLDSKDQPPKSALRTLYVRDNLKMAQGHSSQGDNVVKAQLKAGINAVRDLHPQVRVIEKQLDNLLMHWRTRLGVPKREVDPKLMQKPVVLRRRRERVKSSSNWNLFYYQFFIDHAKPDLIWNFKTREELRDSLENEIRAFNTDKELCSQQALISWNHEEFEVAYPSLNDEIKIGDYYLRLLLEENGDNLMNTLVIKEPFVFFNDLYHRFLLTAKMSMRSACLSAMATVYGAYHQEIGPFNDTKYLVGMLDRTSDKLERDRLLLLLGQLIKNKKNAKEIIEANGIRILVNLLTLAHLHANRATVPMQSNVIEASPEMMGLNAREKEWYYGDAERERKGPISLVELKELYEAGTINNQTKCWAQGIEGWRALVTIPQLKWTMASTGSPILNESDMASRILSMLITICEYFPSRDADGAIVRPLPKVKRILSEMNCLPHIVQLLLTFVPVLVEKVATLLLFVMQENPVMPRLYLTGLFYFIMMYTGSNLLPIGRLLHATHSQQAFRFDENTQATAIQQKSILGQLLPDAMICYLENYGPEKFAQIFLGEFDTPEAIWSAEMRRFMIEKIATHVADFSPRIQSNTTSLYQYCPIPPIQYPQLENELFCNIYYLKNLCDTQRFPNWPIKDPVNLLKDILLAWKQEVEKKPPSMSIEDAFAALGLQTDSASLTDFDENAIRKAYFKMAQKYHPDKNPEGREIFEAVNKAYEFLCSKNVRNSLGGPDPQNIALILRSQSILFNACSEELRPYKYAGYPMLIKTLEMETQDESLFSKPYPLLAHACETAYYTVKCSALNAEELRREGGLEILKEAFCRCVAVISASSKMEDVPVQVCNHIIRCFTVAATFAACRARLIEIGISLSRDLCRILYFSNLTKLCLATVECISAFSSDSTLQLNLYESGVFFSLLLFFFRYDFTLEEGGVETNEESNQQKVANELAKAAVEAAARLCGNIRDQSSASDSKGQRPRASTADGLILRVLNSLLTPYVTKQLGIADSHELLKTLNSNVENPYLIWNNGTRAELCEYLEAQQRETVRSGQPSDASYGADFLFSGHKDELLVGDVFVRVYNQQPMFSLLDPKKFTRDLLDYIGSQAQYLHSMLALKTTSPQHPNANGDLIILNNQETLLSPERVKNVEACLKALCNVIKHNPGVEAHCVGNFKLLFSLLRVEQIYDIQDLAVNVIACVTGSQECVQDIASSDVLTYLLLVLHPMPGQNLSARQQTVLETLVPLMSNASLVKEALAKGLILYALDLFCNSKNSAVREKAAELLSKMCSDKLTGPRIRLLLCKFLPSLFIDAMKDSPQVAIQMFEASQENPELIWNDRARSHVCEVLRKFAEELYQMQSVNINMPWKLPDDYELLTDENIAGNEVVVAGVYLRLFVQNPSWVLRRPKEFLTELMNKCQSMMSKPVQEEHVLELVINSMTSLLRSQPAMLEMIPPMGSIQSLIQNLAGTPSSSASETVPKSCLTIMKELAENSSCVDHMVQAGNLLSQMKQAIVTWPNVSGVACEVLNRMVKLANQDLVGQALRSDIIPVLLKLLDSSSSTGQSNATKALIVQVLQTMRDCPVYGEQIRVLLDKSPIWSEYRDQKHDLFLPPANSTLHLTGPTANVAGYLTQGAGSPGTGAVPQQPPPMEY